MHARPGCVVGNGDGAPVSWPVGACACPARMFAITVAKRAYAGGGGVGAQMRGCMNTCVIIIVTNWRSQVPTLTNPHELLRVHGFTRACVLLSFFFLCVPAPDESEQSDETENGTV